MTPTATDEMIGSANLPSIIYKSRFQNWDTSSWVRSKPHRVAPFDPDLDFFPEALASLFTHPEVKATDRETRRHLLVLHLYNFLEFTVWLELGPVNEACGMLRRDDFLPDMPCAMKDDALRIYVDEGGHAEMSRALMNNVEQATGVTSLRITPPFIRIMDEIALREGSTYHPFVKLFFAIVSETSITGSLIKLPRDPTVQKSVREFAQDHAADEAKHHSYFREVFEFLWPRLTIEMQHKVGAWLPEMLLAFLEPDAEAMLTMLRSVPEKFKDPSKIVAEVMKSQAVEDDVRTYAIPTLRMLQDNGIFNNPHILGAFRQRGIAPKVSSSSTDY